jgi:hypothetical protein
VRGRSLFEQLAGIQWEEVFEQAHRRAQARFRTRWVLRGFEISPEWRSLLKEIVAENPIEGLTFR